MKKFFSKFILKKNKSSIKLEVTENYAIILKTEHVNDFKINEESVIGLYNELNNKINTLEKELKVLKDGLDDRIKIVYDSDLKIEKGIDIEKGTITITGNSKIVT